MTELHWQDFFTSAPCAGGWKRFLVALTACGGDLAAAASLMPTGDRAWGARHGLAHVAALLADDPNPVVRYSAGRNPSTPAEAVDRNGAS